MEEALLRAIGVERVAWEDASDLHRSSLLAWHADFTDSSYGHLKDAYPDLCDAAIALGRHRTPPILQRAQAAAQGAAGQASTPAQPAQPDTPSSPSSTTTVSTDKAAAPSAAVAQAATGPTNQAAAPSAKGLIWQSAPSALLLPTSVKVGREEV